MEIEINDINIEQNHEGYYILSAVLEDGFRFTRSYLFYELDECIDIYTKEVRDMEKRSLYEINKEFNYARAY